MDRIKEIILKNFEQLFVLVILAGIVLLNYHVEQKMAFLNFYFLPVIMAGFYLGSNFSVKGAILIVIMISFFIILYPEEFAASGSTMEVYIHFGVWASFLLLTSAVVGKQQEKLNSELVQNRSLLNKMSHQQEELNKANRDLRDYSENLENKVRERTQALENSNQAIESLKQKVEDTLYATMDSSVAKLLIEGKLRNEKRRVSVMFTDLVGFTSYSEDLNPEQVILELNRYLEQMEPVILAYRGHIDKYLGDGIMCEFGAPIGYDNHRLLAVVSAIKLQEKTTKSNNAWQMRIGVATGETIMGLVGSKRKAYTTIGDVVNVSSRMENICKPGSIYIDEETKKGVERFIKVQQVKGISLNASASDAIEQQLEDLHESIHNATDGKEKAALYKKMGDLLMSQGESFDANESYEKALKLDPHNVELKVAFAESAIKRDDDAKIKFKGRKKRVTAYAVLGLHDPLKMENKFPKEFLEKYAAIKDSISIPDDVILPVEALDGSIGHSTRVAVLAYALACELTGISDTEKYEILHAGFLADIGKEIVPHHLLNRPGSLNDEEFLSIKKHSIESCSVLKKLGYTSEMLLDYILHSHERYNGTGYPHGLKAHDIPIGSRIICVADAFDALTSWRPYHEAWERVSALNEILRNTEKGYFDPEVVEALYRVLGEDMTKKLSA